jgi:nucleoside-diphosphate-sugar epimerase
MTKIFATGTTGYIGGDALYALQKAHPEYEIAVLVRDEKKGEQVKSKLPSVRIVHGDLDDSELIKKEASKADIVAHWAHADHEVSARAIIEGLAQNSSKTKFLIHTSGTGVLLLDHIQKGLALGALSDKVFNDWDGISELTSLPDAAPHRNIDKIVLEAGALHPNVKTAIVAPPTIYGVGRGPVNQRSIQIPDLIKATLKQGYAFQVGEGNAHWSGVHVHDLSNLYVRLVEEAVKGGGSATWGAEGYYFAQSEEFRWGDVGQYIADAAYKDGFIKSKDVKSLTPEEVEPLREGGKGSYLWGVNSRSRAERASKVLGWEPKGKSVEEETPEAVLIEAKALGLTS